MSNNTTSSLDIVLDNDPLLAMVNPAELAALTATTEPAPKSADRRGLGGAILTIVIMTIFFVLVPLDTPNAVPIDMTGVYASAEPVAMPDVLGIEYLDHDVVATR